MRNLLIVILSLMAGCGSSLEVKGCTNGTVVFTCKYHGRQNPIKGVELCKTKTKKSFCSAIVNTMKKNTWENSDRFSLFHDTEQKTLRVVIRELQESDEGIYQCEFKTGIKRDSCLVKLEVEDDGCQNSLMQTKAQGTKTILTCKDPEEDSEESSRSPFKYFCKETNLNCEEFISTKPRQRPEDRFSILVNNGHFSLSISAVTLQDAGVYRCGVEMADGSYRATLRKFHLYVEKEMSATISPASSASSLPTDSTTVAAFSTLPATDSDDMSDGNSGKSVIIIVAVCVAVLLLLLLLLILVLVCKRSKNTGNTVAGNNQEGLHVYEEVQHHPEKPDSGAPLPSIYVTANLPTNPSAFHHYTTVNFKNSPNEASVGTPPAKTSSSVCEYSVNANQSPAYSTVNHPSGSHKEPPYSTVNQPQQL